MKLLKPTITYIQAKHNILKPTITYIQAKHNILKAIYINTNSNI